MPKRWHGAGYEFREGNTVPAARNLEFMQSCEAGPHAGVKLGVGRADSAAYQASIFNRCEQSGNVERLLPCPKATETSKAMARLPIR